MTPIGPFSSATTRTSVVADRDQDVHDAGRHERDRALLDAEERRQLLVVHPAPEPDERRGDEVGAARGVEEKLRDRGRQRDAREHPDGRHRHREPERRPEDEPSLLGLGRVEVEAEERARDAHAEGDPDDRRERDERLDLAVVGGREVPRVERQEEDGDDPRDEAAEPVDRGVLSEPLDLRADRHC